MASKIVLRVSSPVKMSAVLAVVYAVWVSNVKLKKKKMDVDENQVQIIILMIKKRRKKYIFIFINIPYIICIHYLIFNFHFCAFNTVLHFRGNKINHF